MSKVFDFVKPGVITGDDVQKVFAVAKERGFAIPAVNCVGSDSINAALETAARVKAPIIIQFSNGERCAGGRPWRHRRRQTSPHPCRRIRHSGDFAHGPLRQEAAALD